MLGMQIMCDYLPSGYCGIITVWVDFVYDALAVIVKYNKSLFAAPHQNWCVWMLRSHEWENALETGCDNNEGLWL